MKCETGKETAASIGRNQQKSMKEVVSIARQRNSIKHTKIQQRPVAPNSLSPGQQAQAQHISHLVSQPSHPLTQQLLSSYYGLPTPAPTLPGGKKEAKPVHGQVITGPTTEHLTTLPRANRRDAQVCLHPVTSMQHSGLCCYVHLCIAIGNVPNPEVDKICPYYN